SLSADPTTETHRRSPVRDRIFRVGRGGFCVQVRVIRYVTSHCRLVPIFRKGELIFLLFSRWPCLVQKELTCVGVNETQGCNGQKSTGAAKTRRYETEECSAE